MDGLETGAALIAAREALYNPIRKHDADGIGQSATNTAPIPRKEEAALLAFEFLSDVTSPDGYGHAVSPEMVKRASRILAMLRPEPRCGVGYEVPPPARCQHCDES